MSERAIVTSRAAPSFFVVGYVHPAEIPASPVVELIPQVDVRTRLLDGSARPANGDTSSNRGVKGALHESECVGCESDEVEVEDAAPVSTVIPRLSIGQASSDQVLLVGLKRRDPRAVAVFVRRFQHDVQHVLTRIMGTSPDVSDAMQDTFIRALNGVIQVREPHALRVWLRRVATSVAFDHLRQLQRIRWSFLVDCAAIDERADAVTPEDHAVFCDIHRVLDKMPHRERVAFYLRYVDEMELKEIASACNVSIATVKRRLARANLRFRTLAQHQPDLADWMHRQSA
ncbi:MAG: RNA polymerase sigma factor [Polyangiaceae bacterium]